MNYSKSDVEHQIELLEKRIDLETINEIFLFKLLDYFFPSIPIGINIIKKGKELYRGRPSEKGPLFKSVEDFSFVPFPKKLSSKTYGRCNKPTQSLFYCSKNIDIAQMELITHHKKFSIDSLSFGKWVVTDDIVIADIVLPNIDEVKAESIAIKREHFHSLIKADLPEDQLECVKLITDFFGRQFAKSKITSHRHYLYSVYLTNRLLDGEFEGKKIDGVLYPSIATLYQGDNIVLKPEVIINKKLKLIETCELTSGISQGKLFSRLTNRSIEILNDTIIWQDNEVIHGGGYFSDLNKTPLEKGGQGFLEINLKFDRQRLISTLNEMDISFDPKEVLKVTLTVNCEKFIEKYCGLAYNDGTFGKCYISENENLIRLTTPWGFLMNFNGEIMFSLEGKVSTFYANNLIEFTFIPAEFDSEVYKENI